MSRDYEQEVELHKLDTLRKNYRQSLKNYCDKFGEIEQDVENRLAIMSLHDINKNMLIYDDRFSKERKGIYKLYERKRGNE